MPQNDKITFRAIEVFGSPEEAQSWMTHPVEALNQLRPVDLMTSSEGRRRVADCLETMGFKNYS